MLLIKIFHNSNLILFGNLDVYMYPMNFINSYPLFAICSTYSLSFNFSFRIIPRYLYYANLGIPRTFFFIIIYFSYLTINSINSHNS